MKVKLTKVCKKCNIELNNCRFYITRVKDGRRYYSSRCKDCLAKNNSGQHRERIKIVDIEKVSIDRRQIYLLLKRLEINNLQASYFDGLKIINEYIKIYGADIKDYYSEEEQISIMYNKLVKYIGM